MSEAIAGWAELEGLVGKLPGDVRRRVSEAWASAAQAEHASIGSFARFSLELLAVGAPPDLLESAHRAALDEIEHARLSFALASVYAGDALGPGPLPLTGHALVSTELASVVRSTVEEGCVGETLAAIEAEAARDAARPEAVRDVLTRIAQDEARHAALAYEFVAWALATNRAATLAAARAGFEHALAQVRAQPALTGVRESMLSEHGRLPAEERRALRLRALAEVIEPAAARLLVPPSS